MSTVLCPRLVALDPSVCNSVSCRASHTHEPAFCDPCKAVHAAVHSGIHGASIGHRLRVDGPVAPVRCIVCAPFPGPVSAQFLFIGPEHYAAHARTSAHRAKLAQLPPAARSKTKNDFGIGLGRPGDARPFAYTRSSSTGNPYSPPTSRNVTPTPAASRPGSSMSFSSTGQQFGEIPPGPTPLTLERDEYVICALCHTVLPVPSTDVAPVSQRNVSGGSDATVRGRDDDDGGSVIGSVVTTTDNDNEVRKSLVLANHMSTDPEHARRVKFPKFRAAYEKRIAREKKANGEEEVEEPAQPIVEFASRLTETPVPMTRSPDQGSLSSLSSSPSVDAVALDPAPIPGGSGRSGGLFFHQHYRHRRAASQDSERTPEPPKYKFSRDEDYVMQRARSKSRYETSSNGSSERAVVSAATAPRINTKVQGQPQPQAQPRPAIDPQAYVRENDLPISIPDHLLQYLSPVTPSTATPEEELEKYGRSPTSEYFRALPIEAMETPIRTTFMYQLPAKAQAQAQAQASTSSESSVTPERSLQPIPEQPTPATESVQLSPTSSSIHSRPYEPSPSPPPRLAFDDRGNVIKLGNFGWQRETGLLYDDQDEDEEDKRPKRSTSAAAPQIPLLGLGLGPRAPSPSPSPPPVQRSVSQPVQRSVSQPAPVPHSASALGLVPAPPSDSESEEEEEVPAKKEKSVVSGSVGTVKVQRYALEREPVRDPLGLHRSGSERSVSTAPSRSSTLATGPVRSSTVVPARTVQAPVRSSTTIPARSSAQVSTRAAPGRSSIDHTRASTLGPNRTSATIGANRSATVTTRPPPPRTSTGEWAVLGSELGSGTSRVFDEFGARTSASLGAGRQVASLGARPSESWSSGLFNRSPSPLFDTSRPSSSASEASQIIRAFDSPPLDLNLGTPEMLSPKPPRRERSPSPEPSSPERSVQGHSKQASLSSSIHRQSSASPVPRSTGSSPAPPIRIPVSKIVRQPVPSRPYSPSGAWNGLTPASDSSRSTSPSLGESGTFR